MNASYWAAGSVNPPHLAFTKRLFCGLLQNPKALRESFVTSQIVAVNTMKWHWIESSLFPQTKHTRVFCCTKSHRHKRYCCKAAKSTGNAFGCGLLYNIMANKCTMFLPNTILCTRNKHSLKITPLSVLVSGVSLLCSFWSLSPLANYILSKHFIFSNYAAWIINLWLVLWHYWIINYATGFNRPVWPKWGKKTYIYIFALWYWRDNDLSEHPNTLLPLKLRTDLQTRYISSHESSKFFIARCFISESQVWHIFTVLTNKRKEKKKLSKSMEWAG